jgi:hypothetical protein
MKRKKNQPLLEIVGKLGYSTIGADVEYGDTRHGGDGNEKFWNEIAGRLGTECYWNGYEKEINEQASIVEVGIIRIVLLDYENNGKKCTSITRIVMPNGKVVEWEGKTKDEESIKKWIVECYLMALSDQLIRLSAKNAKLLGYNESCV